MATSQQSAGYRAFLTHLDALRKVLTDPAHLATQLYSAGLITQLAHQRAGLATLAPLERSNELLTALDGRLATDEGAFDKFLSILMSDPVMEEMYRKLKETRGERNMLGTVLTLPANPPEILLHSRSPGILLHNRICFSSAQCLLCDHCQGARLQN